MHKLQNTYILSLLELANFESSYQISERVDPYFPYFATDRHVAIYYASGLREIA